MRTFVFDLVHIRHVLAGLRNLRASQPENTSEIDGVICWIKHQMFGKIKVTEPFMRDTGWIADEIAFENQAGVDYHECAEETCKKPCRGKFCASCWKSILSEIHGRPEHQECKK